MLKSYGVGWLGLDFSVSVRLRDLDFGTSNLGLIIRQQNWQKNYK